MTWEEMDYEWSISHIWWDWMMTRIELNARIYASNLKFKDTGFYPITYHQTEHLDSISKFKNYKPDPKVYHEQEPLLERWKSVMKAREENEKRKW